MVVEACVVRAAHRASLRAVRSGVRKGHLTVVLFQWNCLSQRPLSLFGGFTGVCPIDGLFEPFVRDGADDRFCGCEIVSDEHRRDARDAELMRLLLLADDPRLVRGSFESAPQERRGELGCGRKIGKYVDLADVSAMPKERLEDRTMHNVELPVIARKLHALKGQACAGGDRWKPHHESSLGSHRQYRRLPASTSRSITGLRERNWIGSQLERVPRELDAHAVLLTQPVDHRLFEVTVRSNVVREDGDEHPQSFLGNQKSTCWTTTPTSLPGGLGELDQIQCLLWHVSIQTTERYLWCRQKLRCLVKDTLGIGPDCAS